MDFDARYAAHYINDAVEDVITTVIHTYKAKIIQKLRKCFFFVVKNPMRGPFKQSCSKLIPMSDLCDFQIC